ncbi:CDC48 family AAA ATPase, partial [Candidatus Bathyarchaeota archaeon]|nr:CDC48 family AAA ATPase [Candidatus Bathyarchaeota archaeon]
FEDAEKNAPSILFIDEIDAIAPKRSEVTGEVERRVVAQLLASMDGLKGRGHIIVIGATNRPDAIDEALRRPGRFDREVEIGIPALAGMNEIIQIHTRGMPLTEDVNLQRFSEITHGYTGADLEALSREAAMKALRRYLPQIDLEEKRIPHEVLDQMVVNNEDFLDAFREITPTAMREVYIEVPNIPWDEVGGLEEVKQNLKEAVEWPLKNPERFTRLGINPPKGILLHGPPGCGKTLLARAVASESEANFYAINGPEIMSKFYGESEARMRKMFEDAEKNAPSILFIDEIDAIAPKRSEVTGEVERRVVAQLLTLMDGLSTRGNLIVIAATNREDAIDPALRRPGRFDREIVIGVPDRDGRKEVLEIHTRGMPIQGDDTSRSRMLDEFAAVTHGFVGADLASLAREAAMKTLRRYLPEFDLDQPIPSEVIEKMVVTRDDFKEALKEVGPSAMREVLVDIPTITWDDIGGLEDVKQVLREVVELPLKEPEAFKRLGITPPKGVLLYGPPGTGKTLLAKAVANESDANFISIKGPEIMSKWVGESEKAVRQIFKKAKQVAPAIVFLDEIDSIAPTRGSSNDSGATEKVVNQILTSIDGLESMEGVVVIAATNRPDIIDHALLRAGRFDRLVYVGVPEKGARKAIFKVHTRDMPLKKVDIKWLVDNSKGYVGADIEGVCREAGMIAIRENLKAKHVEKGHFEAAFKIVRPSATEETI